jgi:hypothetical protein
MSAYLVRLKSNRELVGLFVSDSTDDLCLLIDECCDPSDCEYKPLPRGGIYYEKAGAPDISTIYRDEPGTGEKMPDWFAGATLSDHWYGIFESERGEKGWKALAG